MNNGRPTGMMRRNQNDRRGFASYSDEEVLEDEEDLEDDFEDEDDDDEDDLDDYEDEDDLEDESEDPESSAARQRQGAKMKCLFCKEEYDNGDAGTCRDCYKGAGKSEQVLKRRIDELEAKVKFLDLFCAWSIGNFSDVVLVAAGASDSADSQCSSPSIPTHRAVLISRSPVFRAMLRNEMEESLSGTIKIRDVSYDALRAFVHFLYTAEAYLDENRACDLLVLAEKYQVQHLKTYCEEYLMSTLNWENALSYYAFSQQHGAKTLLDAALSLIIDNMHKLSQRVEYKELIEKDLQVMVKICMRLIVKDHENRCKYRSNYE